MNNTWIYNNANEYAYQINLSKSCYINILDGKLSTKKILDIDDLKRDYNQTNILFELLKISHLFRNNNNTKKIGFLKLNKGYDNLNNRKIIPITYVIINLVKDFFTFISLIFPAYGLDFWTQQNFIKIH